MKAEPNKEHDLVLAESLYKVVQALAGLSNSERLKVLKSAKEATNTLDEVRKSPGEFVPCRRALSGKTGPG